MSNPKRPKPSLPPTLTLSPSQFSHTLAKTAVAQILKSTGFKSSKSSALETLTRITTLFLQSLSTSAASHASHLGRTHANIFDVLHAIQHLSLSSPFCLPSNTVQDLHYFLDIILQLPFFRRLKLPCVVVNAASHSSLGESNVSSSKGGSITISRGPDIPRWLPEFPEFGPDKSVGLNDKEEGLWEKRRIEYRPLKAAKAEKGKKENVLQGRRERVKFRLVGKKRNTNVSGLDELELRNGVCRGGKRVCLIKNINATVFCEDEDDDRQNCLINGL